MVHATSISDFINVLVFVSSVARWVGRRKDQDEVVLCVCLVEETHFDKKIVQLKHEYKESTKPKQKRSLSNKVCIDRF